MVSSSQPFPERSLPGVGPDEPENHDRLIIPCEIQARRRQTLFQSAAQRFQCERVQVVNEDVRADRDGLRPAVEELGVAHGYAPCFLMIVFFLR